MTLAMVQYQMTDSSKRKELQEVLASTGQKEVIAYYMFLTSTLSLLKEIIALLF
jgi:hypothetical protein